MNREQASERERLSLRRPRRRRHLRHFPLRFLMLVASVVLTSASSVVSRRPSPSPVCSLLLPHRRRLGIFCCRISSLLCLNFLSNAAAVSILRELLLPLFSFLLLPRCTPTAKSVGQKGMKNKSSFGLETENKTGQIPQCSMLL